MNAARLSPGVISESSSGKGRPSSYRSQYAKQAKELCERGATNGQLARFFNVSVSTIWLWRLAYEDFSSAVQLGKKVADDRIEQALFDRAAGYDYDTVKVFRGEDGKPVSSVSSVQERVALLQSIVVVNSAIGQGQEVGRDIFSIDKAPFNHHRYQRPFDLFR